MFLERCHRKLNPHFSTHDRNGRNFLPDILETKILETKKGWSKDRIRKKSENIVGSIATYATYKTINNIVSSELWRLQKKLRFVIINRTTKARRDIHIERQCYRNVYLRNKNNHKRTFAQWRGDVLPLAKGILQQIELCIVFFSKCISSR